jgi:predicted AAA+ superfamily ATPase
MLKRKALEEFAAWRGGHGNRALLVTGARQVGKTYLAKEFLHAEYENVIEFDLVEQGDVRDAFDAARNVDELFMAISAFAGQRLVPGRTVIFINEVQKCKEAITAIKYLVQRKDYDYVLSGSLLGIGLRDIRSLPVGYVHIVDMYPLDFEEFCWANGVDDDIIDGVRRCFEERAPVFEPVHERLLSLFHHYLMVGGMPAAVEQFVANKDMGAVHSVQGDIIRLYRDDISQYAPDEYKLVIREIFDQMPSQLDSQSKRFTFSSIAPRGTYERYENQVLWFINAGVALQVISVTEPRRPLKLSEKRSCFKLFMDDVGLLCRACGMGVVRGILSDKLGVNYGSIYENAVSQELKAHGHDLHYCRSKKLGEVDFVCEHGGGTALPIEVKSGKDYKRHSALNSVISSPNYEIEQAFVLCEDNVSEDGKVLYLPTYMVMFV